MEEQNPDHGPAAPGPRLEPAPRTFARRIDCAPPQRQAHAEAAVHGPGYGRPLDQAA